MAIWLKHFEKNNFLYCRRTICIWAVWERVPPAYIYKTSEVHLVFGDPIYWPDIVDEVDHRSIPKVGDMI